MQKRKSFLEAKNYVVLYSEGFEDELSLFDIVIVEPSARNQALVRRIKKNGAVVLAYLSVMEIPKWSEDLRLLKSGDFLTINGKPLVNETYHTYIADLCSASWRNILCHKAGKLFFQQEYDGFFLDTVGDIELPEIQDDKTNALTAALVELLVQIKKISKDIIIVQNNGLEKLCLGTRSLIDGICWENPPFESIKSSIWTKSMVKRLCELKNLGLQVMLLMEERGNQNGEAAKRLNYRISMAQETASQNEFLLYIAPEAYTGRVNSRFDLKTT